jgi:site-specific recombinase XerD
VRPLHAAGYIEQLQGSRKAPTVKQHLACIRMLFDWLVTGQVLPSNPAHAVRGPRHSLIKGATTVMSSQETSEFLKSIETAHVVDLRDRAFIGVMVYASARVSAVVSLKVEDYFPLSGFDRTRPLGNVARSHVVQIDFCRLLLAFHGGEFRADANAEGHPQLRSISGIVMYISMTLFIDTKDLSGRSRAHETPSAA